MGWERLTAAAGDLLLGASCHGCGVPWWGVCPPCRAQLGARQPHRTEPVPPPTGFPFTMTSGPYDDLARQLITAHKERQALGLTRVLAEPLARCVFSLIGTDRRPVTLVSVPSAAATVRARGFDATAGLARLAAERLCGVAPVRARALLAQRGGVADQAGLGAQQRADNLRGAFRLRRDLPGGVVVIVDDVVTTGSSLAEAARVLRAAGAELRGAATIAATVRRRPGRVSGP